MDIMDIAIAKALSGGGGGGTGGLDVFVVYVTATPVTNGNGYNYATETAYADVLAELEAGKIVVYWVTFDRDKQYIDTTMSVYVGYSKSGDAIYLTLGDGNELIHTADGGIEEDG